MLKKALFDKHSSDRNEATAVSRTFLIDAFYERSLDMRNLKAKIARISPILIAYVLLIGLPVRADVGLIWTAQGGDIAPGEEPTQVQMVSETVTLTLETLEPSEAQGSPRADEGLVAHVDAVFQMQNQGGDTETHDVWFPLTTGAGYGAPFPPDAPSQAENFQAWVEGEPVTVTEAPGRDLLGFRDEVPWATWSVAFPPGQAVLLRVTYDVHPVDWGGWAVAHYILETGADWHGPIGAGTVTFRLPYEVTPLNVQVAEIREAYTGPDRPFEIAVDGTDVTWRFTDLEPSPFPTGRERATRPFPETDNLILPLMLPLDWVEIEAARADAEANPNSVEAQVRLAAALEAGTQRVKAFSATEANTLLIGQTDAAYQRALELEPQDVDTRVAYLKWLAVPRYDEKGDLTLGKGLDDLLSETRELAPNDQRVRRVEVSVRQWREDLAASRSDAPTTMPIGMPESGSPRFGGLYPGAVIVGGLILILGLGMAMVGNGEERVGDK